jgi:hypothetical protein
MRERVFGSPPKEPHRTLTPQEKRRTPKVSLWDQVKALYPHLEGEVLEEAFENLKRFVALIADTFDETRLRKEEKQAQEG